MPYCWNCGSQTTNEDANCRECGKTIEDTDSLSNLKRSNKKNVIIASSIILGILLVLFICKLTYDKHEQTYEDGSPSQLVFFYLKSIDTQNDRMFLDTMYPTTGNALILNTLLQSKDTTYGFGDTSSSETSILAYEKQMVEAKGLFRINFKSNWLDKVQISEGGKVTSDITNVSISIEGHSTKIQLNMHEGKWRIETEDLNVLLPEMYTLFDKDITESEGVLVKHFTQNPAQKTEDGTIKTKDVANEAEISTNEIDYMDLLSKGVINGLEFGIGSNIKDITKKWGKPNITDNFTGSRYAKYDSRNVTFFYDNVTGEVFMIGLPEGTNVYGILIGDTADKIMKVLGKAELNSVSSSDAELMGVNDNYILIYNSGSYGIDFHMDYYQKSNVAYVYKIYHDKQTEESTPTEPSEQIDNTESIVSSTSSDEDILTYTVKSGDTISSISNQFYNDPNKYDVILKFNNIKENSLYVGQVLKIP